MAQENKVISGSKNLNSMPNEKGRDFSIDLLKFILMFFVCINLANFPGIFGELISYFCGFAPIAFFIISGYLVLKESPHRSQRILRAMKHSGITFAILTLVYFAANYFYARLYGSNIIPLLASKRLWFDFVVLNVWPFDIGNSLWYIQAIFYAYVILFIMDKLKLLKFDWLFSAILLIFSILVGEFSGLINFNFLGYTYISGNFLTKAIPYLLLGSFISRKKEKFAKLSNMEYIFFTIFGVCFMISEITALYYFDILRYAGHLIGMPLIAVSVCMLAIKNSRIPSNISIMNDMVGYSTKILYYFYQPLTIIIISIIFAENQADQAITSHVGLILYVASLILIFIGCFFRRLINIIIKLKKQKN